MSIATESQEITTVSISRDLVASLKDLENATIYLVSTRFSFTHTMGAPIREGSRIVSLVYRIASWVYRVESHIREMSLYDSRYPSALTAWFGGVLKDIHRVTLTAGLLQDDMSQSFYAVMGKDLEGRDIVFNFDYCEIHRLLHDPKDNSYFIWLDD